MVIKVRPLYSKETMKMGTFAKLITMFSKTYILPFDINYENSSISLSWKSMKFGVSCMVVSVPFLVPMTFVILQPQYYLGFLKSGLCALVALLHLPSYYSIYNFWNF